MKHHITKALAVMLSVFMLVGMIPTAVLPVFAASSEQSTGIFDTVTLGKGSVTNTENYLAGAGNATGIVKDVMGNDIVDNMLSPYEPYTTTDETHPFLDSGAAWIDLSKIYYGAPATPNIPMTKWSANTSVVNITGTGKNYDDDTATYGVLAGKEIQAIRDHNLISEYLWAKDYAVVGGENQGGVISSGKTPQASGSSVIAKNGTEAFVYNRYDAMQGKWGLTLDKYVSSVTWAPTYVNNYYGTGKDYDSSILYLTDTPYLYFSTEALDNTQMAISLLIGTPMQEERKTGSSGTTSVKWKTDSNYNSSANIADAAYEFRWYTITDNSARPGVDNASQDNSMVPLVTVSDPVLTWHKLTNNVNDILDAMGEENQNPIMVAENAGVDTESMYVSGSITGCIDFTQLLPLIKAVSNGRADVQYKIAQIRVDTKTKTRADGDSAARINYMYFGPGQAAVLTPQSTVGNDVDGMNWMYAKNDGGVGDENPNWVANSDQYYIGNRVAGNDNWESGYTNGWHNGEAVTIENSPKNPQLMTIDTYGLGDGKLISYDQYETEMRDHYKSKGAYQKENGDWYYTENGVEMPLNWICRFNRGSENANSMIWRVTDKNEVVQYYEAAYNSQDKNYYIMVTVPVRKWINVLGDSRKLSMTVKTLQYGKKGNTDTVLTDDPSFCIWGNAYGAFGAHASIALGVRYSHEDILGVFGKGYYNVDGADKNYAAFVDRTISESVKYNNDGTSEESWFDWLRSPYVFDRTVKAAIPNYGVTDAMAGYTFVTSMRFVMPIGSAMSVQSMKGDGNSAGLNTYSTSGEIVSAYDGGSGAKPVINVTNSLPEKQVTISKTGTGNTKDDFTYTQSTLDNNGLKGTISAGSAAYGPMLQESRYTIYDLLDTEMIRATGKDSLHKDYTGKAKQPIYGEMWVANQKLIIYHTPLSVDTNASKYGSVASGYEFCVYATVKFTDDGNKKWGLVGVLTSSSTTELGWVLIYDGSSATSTRVSGVPLYEDVDVTKSTFNSSKYTPYKIVNELKGDWAISNFSSVDKTGTYMSSFYDTSGTTHKYSELAEQNNTSHQETLNEGHHIISTSTHGKYGNAYNSSLQLKFANQKTAGYGHYSSGISLPDFYFRSINGTDLEWGFKRQTNTSSNMSMGMTRVFKTPFVIKKGNNAQHNSYPVLYLDYTATTNFKIGISLRYDGRERLWYVDDSEIVHGDASVNSGNHYAYLSLENILSKDYKNASKVEVVALSLYMWNGPSVSEGNVVLRRCEIWQSELEWYDEIISANQEGHGTSTNMNEKVVDSIQIINDAFYNTYDESSDGEVTVTKVGDYASNKNIGVNNNDTTSLGRGKKYSYSDGTGTNSYKKSNSNKGWKAYLRNDTDGDGKIEDNGDDETYYSFGAKYVPGIYEYASSVGNLRIWLPGKSDTSVVFESDRSFSTQNYKYLYYSYSMRDVDTGIAAEESAENRTDGKEPGVSVAIKSTQIGSAEAYSEIVADGKRTWAYYPDGHAYWSDDGRDNRTFKTTINAAADLSTFNGIESVNQFVFYLHNPLDQQAEFYINYIYLSNIEPEKLIADSLSTTQKQYYYMMDNTGDRYSARFPTIDNPTGQVLGTNSDNDRVNPIVIERGQLISTGTYFNGDRLYGYGGDANTNREFDTGIGSDGFYEKTYGNDKTPNTAENGSMKNILFYNGTSDDLNDINDYYEYVDRGRTYTYIGEDDKLVTETVKADGKGDIYDMMWSYGRWFTGEGSGGLNILYIGDPEAPEHQQKNDYSPDRVSGGLSRRYATENYVLLRSGITPKKYLTHYDANGGDFVYLGSPTEHKNLSTFNENSYYTTSTPVQSYFENLENKEAMFNGSAVKFTQDGDTYTTVDEPKKTFKAVIYDVYATKNDDGTFTYTATTESGSDVVSHVAKFYTLDGNLLPYSWFDNNRNSKIDVDEIRTHYYLQKPGYLFSHWEAVDATGTVIKDFNNNSSTDGNGAKLLKILKKLEAKVDYFRAVWVEDPAYKDDVYTATFYSDTNKSSVLINHSTEQKTEEAKAINGKFVLTIPRISNVILNGERKQIYGWYKVNKDGSFATDRVYKMRERIYLLEDTEFVPVIDASQAPLFEIDVIGGQLKVKSIHNILHPATDYGAIETPMTDANDVVYGYSYKNIIPDYYCVAVPLDNKKAEGSGWTRTDVVKGDKQELKYLYGNTSTIVSANYERYDFIAFEDMDITYTSLGNISSDYAKDDGVYVTSSPSTAIVNRRLPVYSSFSLPENYTAIEFGTIRTVSTTLDPYLDTLIDTSKYANMNDDEKKVAMEQDKLTLINQKMRFDDSWKTQVPLNRTYVGTVKFAATAATEVSMCNQFLLNIGVAENKSYTYYVRAYVIYQDESGNEKIAYGDVAAVTGIDKVA